MKVCPMCGREYPDYKSFCDADESPLTPNVGTPSISELGEPESVTRTRSDEQTESLPNTENLSEEEPPVFDENKTEPMVVEWIGAPPPAEELRQAEDDDEETLVRPKEELPEDRPGFQPMGAPQPHYNMPPMPPPPQSNPWKAAFFALLGVVAIGVILFATLRGKLPAENTNNPNLNVDPNANMMQPVPPPTGMDENINTMPPQNMNMNMNGNANMPYPYPYPPYPEVNMNANTNINTNVNINTNANANVRPSPSPRNTNANTNINANTNTNTNTNTRPSPTPKPSVAPTPKPPTPSPTPNSDGRR